MGAVAPPPTKPYCSAKHTGLSPVHARWPDQVASFSPSSFPLCCSGKQAPAHMCMGWPGGTSYTIQRRKPQSMEGERQYQWGREEGPSTPQCFPPGKTGQEAAILLDAIARLIMIPSRGQRTGPAGCAMQHGSQGRNPRLLWDMWIPTGGQLLLRSLLLFLPLVSQQVLLQALPPAS